MDSGTLNRFWSKVNKTSSCWLWTAHLNNHGYGKFMLNGKATLAHRTSWVFEFGAIPKDHFICHKCDVPACVRPDHLFLGDRKSNVADMISKGRGARGAMLPQSKLNSSQVREIKRLLSTGSTQVELGQHYGVSNITISDIARGVTWKHV